jgi:hypothetical protein
MRAGRGARALTTGLAMLVLSACGNDGPPDLMNIRTTSRTGPDEFSIVPPKPLELPESLTVLPEPTPGGINRTDPRPQEEAILALGGRPNGGAGGNAALMSTVSRYGTDPAIREELAAADLEFRSENRGRPLERLFNINVYYSAYADQSLDQYMELRRWRAAGARTPSAPPEP